MHLGGKEAGHLVNNGEESEASGDQKACSIILNERYESAAKRVESCVKKRPRFPDVTVP